MNQRSTTLALKLRSSLGRLSRSQSGQAMVEYATLSYFLLIAAGGPLMFKFGPQFLDALNTYLTDMYAWVNMAMP